MEDVYFQTVIIELWVCSRYSIIELTEPIVKEVISCDAQRVYSTQQSEQEEDSTSILANNAGYHSRICFCR